MNVSLIVATDRNGIIGDDVGIPWRLPNDLKRFRKLTWGKPILMGRTTHEHIGRALPGRTNIVLSRQPGYEAEGCLVAPDLAAGLKLAEPTGADEILIIGGGKVYRESLPICRTIYLTRVDGEFKGSVSFPLDSLDPEVWRTETEEHVPADAENPYASDFIVLRRI